MKKSYLLIGLAIVVAIVAVYFIMFYPPVDSDDAAGRFGKVDKYREYSIGDGDIILRSDLLQDDVQAKKLISDLVEFADFSVYVKSIIDNWWLPVLQEYHSSASINEALHNLKEFSDFISNNNQTVFNTIVTIAELSTADELKITKDIESQLIQFNSFATQFLIRDSIFESTISKIDLTFENEKLQKAAIDDLRSLRDRIVIDNLFYGFTIGDTSKIAYSMIQPLNSSEQLQYVRSTEDGLSQMLTSNLALKTGFTNQIHDVSDLQSKEFIQSALGLGSNSQLQNYFLQANQSIYFSFSQEQLQRVFNQDNLNFVLNQQNLGAVNSQNRLEAINLLVLLNTEILGVVYDKEKIDGIVWTDRTQLGGIVWTDKTKLESFWNEHQLGIFISNAFNMSSSLEGLKILSF